MTNKGLRICKGVIWALWSNEITFSCLSKVVRQGRKYLDKYFHSSWINTYGIFLKKVSENLSKSEILPGDLY
ncbi:uncharacterized protein OCT59_003620 [Rhizophagus irregularis]|uniref:uncharacterized protein n=1 Tax=Rhizophagus irregularis TaxID=588596 RepID=UPI003324D89D|nr:hypothetical protein OCT59_003620 [Rhizophagus irregularis]